MPKWVSAILWMATGYLLLQLGEDFFGLIPEFRLATFWRSYRSIVFLLYAAAATMLWVAGVMYSFNIWHSPIISVKQVFNKLQTSIAKTPIGFRRLLADSLIVLPTWLLLFSSFAFEPIGIYLRLFILVVSAFLITMGFYTTRSAHQLLFLFFRSFIIVMMVFFAGGYLTNVSPYPFSIGWSEGNRLWDYSIWAGLDRYLYNTNEGIFVSISLGKKWLFGLPYLIPDLGIFGVRLWDAMLKILPALLLGFILVPNDSNSKNSLWSKILFSSWGFIFLLQGPIQVPLVISAVLIALALKTKRLPYASVVVIIAGYFASISRFTWAYAPGLWVGMIALAQIKNPGLKRKDWHKLRRPITLGIAGYLGGEFTLEIIRFIFGDVGKMNLTLFQGITNFNSFNQPLLWERLLPNPTFPPGILLALIFVILPIGVWWYLAYKHQNWRLNWLQILGIGVPMLAFLSVGLVASVKIGGGADLHNLDMFLIGLLLVGSLAWPKIMAFLQDGSKPVMLMIIAIISLISPIVYSLGGPKPLLLPPQENAAATLLVIQEEIAKASLEGDILFMDQRQLLTFGYIADIALISEYEKKWVMDKAMSGNSAYFEIFYEDLINHRFALIVSEPLFLRTGDVDKPFPEENDAWVTWVSEPLLKYYRVLKDFKVIGIQLLIPRVD